MKLKARLPLLKPKHLLLPLRKKPPKLLLLHRKRRNSAVLLMQSTTWLYWVAALAVTPLHLPLLTKV